MRKIFKLSPSQLSCFEWCPLQWRYRYLDKIKMPPSHALTFGIAVHEGMEKFLIDHFRSNLLYETALSNAQSAFDFSYIFDADDNVMWKERGHLIIQALAEIAVDKIDSVVQVETFYNKLLLPSVKFTGKVDCLAKLKDGSTVIIDWKTANKNYTRKKVETDRQLTFYRWLAGNHQVAFVVANKNTCEAKWYLTARSDEQVEQALDIARRIHMEMQEREEFRGVYDNRCDWCEFNGNYCGGNTGDF